MKILFKFLKIIVFLFLLFSLSNNSFALGMEPIDPSSERLKSKIYELNQELRELQSRELPNDENKRFEILLKIAQHKTDINRYSDALVKRLKVEDTLEKAELYFKIIVVLSTILFLIFIYKVIRVIID